MPKINPEMLVWARETAGLSLEEAAERLKDIPLERLDRMERGEADPTRTQLNRMAKLYHRPAVLFYMPKPPKEFDSPQIEFVIRDGYGFGQDTPSETDLVEMNEDPILIAYAYTRELLPRCVVTNEISKPSRQKANSKIPDVCKPLSVPCVNIWTLIEYLDFTTEAYRSR